MIETRDDESAGIANKASASTVAVVISTYNRAHLIGETIDSILAQSRAPDELIIVNDGSTDDTAAVIAGYGERIRYFEKENAGKSVALNHVVPFARSKYICVFDDDDIMLPEALETHMAFLAEHPEYDFSYGPNYAFEAPATIESITRHPPRPLLDVPAEGFFVWMMEAPFLPTPMQGMLIPARCFEAVGLFDPSLARSQDRDMVMRLARRFRAGRIEKPLWALREHSGARGPGYDSHDVNERYAVWWRYKRPVFSKLRQSLSLEEYLVPTQLAQANAPNREDYIRRYGLLQRAVIMAIHGLFDEAIADISSYCEFFQAATDAPDKHERRLISRLAHVHAIDTLPPDSFYIRLGKLCRGRSKMLRAGLRGLYWSGRREMTHNQYASCLRITKSAVNLIAGASRLPFLNRRSSAR